MVSFFSKLKKTIRDRFREIPQRLRDIFGGGGQEQQQTQTSRGGGGTSDLPFTEQNRQARAGGDQTPRSNITGQDLSVGGALGRISEGKQKRREFLESQIQTETDPIRLSDARNELTKLGNEGVSTLEGSLIQQQARQGEQEPKVSLSKEEQFGADIVKGLKIGAAIGVPLAIAIVTLGTGALAGLNIRAFASGVTRLGKGIPASTRAATNLNKVFRAGKISPRIVGRVTREIDRLKVSEVIARLQSPKGIRRFLFKTTATATFSAGIAEWYAADNLATGSKIASNQIVNQVRFGQLSKEDGLEVIDRSEFNTQIARAAVVGAMAIAPLSAPVGFLFLKGITSDIEQIEVNRKIVEGL